jgi:hypothetical protein
MFNKHQRCTSGLSRVNQSNSTQGSWRACVCKAHVMCTASCRMLMVWYLDPCSRQDGCSIPMSGLQACCTSNASCTTMSTCSDQQCCNSASQTTKPQVHRPGIHIHVTTSTQHNNNLVSHVAFCQSLACVASLYQQRQHVQPFSN